MTMNFIFRQKVSLPNCSIGLLLILWAGGLSGCSSTPKIDSENQGDKQEIRYLEDKILLIESRSIYEKIELVNKLSAESPKSYLLISRRFILEKQLEVKVSNLLSCVAYHQAEGLNLALKCAKLAHEVTPSDNTQQVLDETLQLATDRTVKRQSITQAKVDHKHNALMALAKKQMTQPNFVAGIETLEKLLKISPDDEEVKKLLAELTSRQAAQVADLTTMGDNLYLEENIEQALAVWQAVIKLDPENQEVLSRIDRAHKVIEKMDQIKEQLDAPDNH